MAEKSPMLDDFPSELNHGVAATGGFPHWPYSGADNQAQEEIQMGLTCRLRNKIETNAGEEG